MNLYIETDENGNVKNHPAFEDNLIQAFGSIPNHWEKFVRIERPAIGTYQIIENDEPTYEKVDGVWTDVWAIRNMTEEEKSKKQQDTKDVWASLPNRENYATWTFDEETCTYQPPVPMPTDGPYIWSGVENNWVSVQE